MPEEWTTEHAETIKGVKRYGLLSAAICIMVVLIAAGMPGHFLWRWLGIPLIIAFACAFTPFLFYGGRLLWEWLEKTGK